jgi:thiamine-phosphate pyrophosphorylase
MNAGTSHRTEPVGRTDGTGGRDNFRYGFTKAGNADGVTGFTDALQGNETGCFATGDGYLFHASSGQRVNYHNQKGMQALPGIYPILDTASLERRNFPPVLVAEAFLEGGAQILQLRHKAFWSRDTFGLAKQLAVLCEQANVRFVVNDRADYAAILGAALHVGQDDLLPEDARRVVGPDALIGFSTHNSAQMAASEKEPVDYVAFGPVFPTTSKEHPDPTTGIELLRTVRSLTNRPLVAIGGITRENAHLCFDAGATSVAVISDLLPVSFPLSDAKRILRERIAEWLRIAQR